MKPITLLLIVTSIIATGAVAAPKGKGPTAHVQLGLVNIESGISVINSGDGLNEPAQIAGSKCRVNKADSDPPSYCMYFDYDPRAGAVERPVFVTVEYFDKGFGAFVIQYDSTDADATDQGIHKTGRAETLLDSRKWRKATFELPDARFDGRQNSGADFRVVSRNPLAVRQVTVDMGRTWSPLKREETVKQRISESLGRLRPTKGARVVFGGIDTVYPEDASQVYTDLKVLAPAFKALGATSVQCFVRWDFVEPEKGRWNWSYYDGIADILRSNGLKWTPYLVIGPAFATPKWFRESSDSVFATCLEHGMPSKVQSIWNPRLQDCVEQFISEFAKRYGGKTSVESVLLGVSGDVGEAVYPVTNEGWTTLSPGDYHSHSGFWCGDGLAGADFKRFAESRYGRVEALNNAWGTTYTDFSEVKPILPGPDTSARARLDFIKWYRDRMTRWANVCLSAAREKLPGSAIYLVTGGDGHPEHGVDFSAQCKVAADSGAGVRLTNEASDFAFGFAVTRLASTAARFYEADCAFGPSGVVSPAGVTSRLFNAASSKVNATHFYYPSVLVQPGGLDAWSKSYNLLGVRDIRRLPVAVLYPQTSLSLKWGGFYDKVMQLRDAFDFDMIDERMIEDGALGQYKILVLIEGRVIEADDFARIAKWVNSGGVIVTCDFGEMTTVEGDPGPFRSMFDLDAKTSVTKREHAQGLAYYVAESWGDQRNPAEAIARVLESLSSRLQTNLVPDGEVDGVYISQATGRLLALNTGQTPVERDIRVGIGKKRSVSLAAGSVSEIKE